MYSSNKRIIVTFIYFSNLFSTKFPICLSECSLLGRSPKWAPYFYPMKLCSLTEALRYRLSSAHARICNLERSNKVYISTFLWRIGYWRDRMPWKGISAQVGSTSLRLVLPIGARGLRKWWELIGNDNNSLIRLIKGPLIQNLESYRYKFVVQHRMVRKRSRHVCYYFCLYKNDRDRIFRDFCNISGRDESHEWESKLLLLFQ